MRQPKRRVADSSGPTFEEVFRAEQHDMFRLACLLLGTQHQAEEAVQDAFARLLDRFDTVENPGGFVRTATVNRCRDLLRRRRREETILRWIRPKPPATLGARDLDDVLGALDPDRREVIVLRFHLGHTTAEIAELLGIPEGTVRSRMQRALTVLRGEVHE